MVNVVIIGLYNFILRMIYVGQILSCANILLLLL